MKINHVMTGLMVAHAGLFGSSASAGYDCISLDRKTSLIFAKAVSDQAPSEYVARVNGAQDGGSVDILFNADPESEEISDLYSKRQYFLWEFSPAVVDDAILTIVSNVKMGRGGCGRGSCPPDGARNIQAKLKYKGKSHLGESGVDFSCVETIEFSN